MPLPGEAWPWKRGWGWEDDLHALAAKAYIAQAEGDLAPSRPVRVGDLIGRIIGAGPGGICSGVRLLEAGYRDFVIFEKAPGIGGTWFHNRYPGAACDVPSHLYSYSFAKRRDWSRLCSPQWRSSST